MLNTNIVGRKVLDKLSTELLYYLPSNLSYIFQELTRLFSHTLSQHLDHTLDLAPDTRKITLITLSKRGVLSQSFNIQRRGRHDQISSKASLSKGLRSVHSYYRIYALTRRFPSGSIDNKSRAESKSKKGRF